MALLKNTAWLLFVYTKFSTRRFLGVIL